MILGMMIKMVMLVELENERSFLYLFPQAPIWRIREVEDKIKSLKERG